MSENVLTGAKRREPTIFEVYFDDNARPEDRWGWLLKVQKDANVRGIEFGAKRTDQGYMMAFRSEADAENVMASVQAKTQAHAEQFRRRLFERVGMEFCNEEAKDYTIRTGMPPPSEPEQP